VDGKPANSQTMSTPHSNEQLNVIVRERHPAPCTSLCESDRVEWRMENVRDGLRTDDFGAFDRQK